MKKFYDFPDEKRIDIKSKMNLWARFKLLFVKKQISKDFIHDSSKGEIWSEATYKVLSGKCYVFDYKTYYVVRPSHLKKMNERDFDEMCEKVRW